MHKQLQHSEKELRLLGLLAEARALLQGVRDALNGKSTSTKEANYLIWIAIGVLQTSDGYLLLRSNFRCASSKHLIRPTIEMVLNGGALINDKEFFFRKAMEEFKEENKLKPNSDFEAEAKRIREAAAREGVAIDKKQKLTVSDVARMAGQTPTYQTLYRQYCQFSHGALRAITGGWDDATDKNDTVYMAFCVIITIDLLGKVTLPVPVPSVTDLQQRLMNEAGIPQQ